MLIDKMDKLNQQFKSPDKKQYLIAKIVFEHDAYYIVQIGHNYLFVTKGEDIIVHDYKEEQQIDK